MRPPCCNCTTTPATPPWRSWLLGETYSAADPLAFMLCRWTRGFARPARSLPRLGDCLQRMLARPAVKQAIAVEGLPQPWV